jgi:hypothetical protein
VVVLKILLFYYRGKVKDLLAALEAAMRVH